jgi:hypothetical protein
MHQGAVGHAREKIVQQVMDAKPSVKDYANYVPIGDAAKKVRKWADQNVEIIYMTSRRKKKEIDEIQKVLDRNHFPAGTLEYRTENEEYKDAAERIMPDVLIEDDCESIGGEIEMTYPHISPELKKKTKSMAVKEFSGIDHLPDNVAAF